MWLWCNIAGIALPLRALPFSSMQGIELLAGLCGMTPFGLKAIMQRKRLRFRLNSPGAVDCSALPGPTLPNEPPALHSSGSLEQTIRGILDGLDALAARHYVRLQFAVQRGVVVHIDLAALRPMLCDVVAYAIRAGAGGCVLVTARVADGCVVISIAHDRTTPAYTPLPTLRLREARLRVRNDGDAGTTVLLEFPEHSAWTDDAGSG